MQAGAMGRALIGTVVLAAFVAAFPSAAAAGFGFAEVDLSLTTEGGSPVTQAGSHPDTLSIEIAPTTEEDPDLGEVPAGQPRDLWVWLPPGLVGSPDATPRCSNAHFSTTVGYAEGAVVLPDCPDAAAIGLAAVEIGLGGERVSLIAPVYNLVPAPGTVASLGFYSDPVGPMTIDLALSEFPPYELVASVSDIPEAGPFYGADVTLWGDPGASLHDDDRGVCGASAATIADLGDFLGITCPTSIPPIAFITSPRSCTGPLETFFEAESWLGEYAEAVALTHDNAKPPNPLGVFGCERLDFSSSFSAEPTNLEANSHTGLDFDLEFATEGITNVNGIASSDLEEIEVALPPGTAIDASRLESLPVCSEADFERETADSELGEGCPAASRIGTVEVETPLLQGVLLTGSVFLGKPTDPHTPAITLYMTVKQPKLGIGVYPVGELWREPESNQLVIGFHDLPQLPFSHFHLSTSVNDLLCTPPLPGPYETESFLVPWADPSSVSVATDPFVLEEDLNSGPCPSVIVDGGSGFLDSSDPVPSLNGDGLRVDGSPGKRRSPRCKALMRQSKRLARRARKLAHASRRTRQPPRSRTMRRKAHRFGNRAKRKRRAARICRLRAPLERSPAP